MKGTLIVIILLISTGCQSPEGRWFDGLSKYKEIRSRSMHIELMKMDTEKAFTFLNYKLRIYPVQSWIEEHESARVEDMNYHMDSCFFIQEGKNKYAPLFVQPVANGVKHCFEYLLSFPIQKVVKKPGISMVYSDKFIDHKTYLINLN